VVVVVVVSCATDVSGAVGKFYAQFNNISVLNREIPTVQFIKSYCLSSLLCACEMGFSKKCDVHSGKVAFRKIFDCCWKENPKILQFYTVDQRCIVSSVKIKCHEMWC